MVYISIDQGDAEIGLAALVLHLYRIHTRAGFFTVFEVKCSAMKIQWILAKLILYTPVVKTDCKSHSIIIKFNVYELCMWVVSLISKHLL